MLQIVLGLLVSPLVALAILVGCQACSQALCSARFEIVGWLHDAALQLYVVPEFVSSELLPRSGVLCSVWRVNNKPRDEKIQTPRDVVQLEVLAKIVARQERTGVRGVPPSVRLTKMQHEAVGFVDVLFGMDVKVIDGE